MAQLPAEHGGGLTTGSTVAGSRVTQRLLSMG